MLTGTAICRSIPASTSLCVTPAPVLAIRRLVPAASPEEGATFTWRLAAASDQTTCLARGWTQPGERQSPATGLPSSLATQRPPGRIDPAGESGDAPFGPTRQTPEPAEAAAVDGDVGRRARWAHMRFGHPRAVLGLCDVLAPLYRVGCVHVGRQTMLELAGRFPRTVDSRTLGVAGHCDLHWTSMSGATETHWAAEPRPSRAPGPRRRGDGQCSSTRPARPRGLLTRGCRGGAASPVGLESGVDLFRGLLGEGGLEDLATERGQRREGLVLGP